MSNIITGFGGLDGQYLWISESIEEVLGLTAEQIRKQQAAIVPVFPNTQIYAQILAEEKQRRVPRLTFRSWQIKVRNNGDTAPLTAIALFQRDDNGEIINVVGAAWPCTDCPACSQMPNNAADLRRTVLNLSRAAADSL